MPKDSTPPNIVEKTFTNSYRTVKFAKVFSLETFSLYGTLYTQASLSTRLGQVVKECGGWMLVCIEYRVHRVQSTQSADHRVHSAECTECRVHRVQSTHSAECRVHSIQRAEYRVHSVQDAHSTECRVQSAQCRVHRIESAEYRVQSTWGLTRFYSVHSTQLIVHK